MPLPAGHRTDVNLALQALCLRREFPQGHLRLTPGRLIWEGEVRPLPACDAYTLQLTAEPALRPTVRVLAPDLVPDDDGLLPHVYDDGSLCVSTFGDFRPGMLFVDTVLPWSLEWLVHYEQWRAGGVWFGDGPDRLDPESQSLILHPYNAVRSLPTVKGHR